MGEQPLADFRGLISLLSKFPSLQGLAECLWVSCAAPSVRCSGTPSSGLPSLPGPSPLSPTLPMEGGLRIPTSAPLLPRTSSVLSLLPKLGLPLSQQGRSPQPPASLPLCPGIAACPFCLSLDSCRGHQGAGTCPEPPISEGTDQRTQISDPSPERPA